jgi:sugar/nucleoside kinase (ribokinase family)
MTVGESLVEIMRLQGGKPLDQPGEFMGPFASGAPAIFAVAVARLKMTVGLISTVGDDAFGRLIRSRLECEGVDTTQVRSFHGLTTGVAFVAYAADGSREFIFHLRQTASSRLEVSLVEPETLTCASWLHLSGSTVALSEANRMACKRALDLVLPAGGRLSFDPNLRPELMTLEESKRALAPFLDAAYLLLPTAEEAHLLTGTEDDEVAARELLGGRTEVVVFKRGAQGCAVFTLDGRLDIPGFEVEEVDPTGAGDCFNAAFIYGLDSNWPLEEVAVFACAAGALAVTRQGPMEGAPSLSQIESLTKQESVKGE